MVDIVIDENIIKHVSEYDAIIVPTNCYQSMTNGFQYEVRLKYPYVLKQNFQTKYGDKDKLGQILECREESKPLFILIFTTFGYNFKGNNDDFFDYDALEKCLRFINILYKGKHLATTMIGCSKFDGNADKNRVLTMVNSLITDCNLTIYDYKQESQKTIRQKEYFKKLKERDKKNLINQRKRKTNHD